MLVAAVKVRLQKCLPKAKMSITDISAGQVDVTSVIAEYVSVKVVS